jgi:hypothetical protein
LYKTTDYWYPEHERSLLWNDPTVGVRWPLQGQPQLAAKDAAGKSQLLGSDTNFAAVRGTATSGRAKGSANLGSDPIRNDLNKRGLHP